MIARLKKREFIAKDTLEFTFGLPETVNFAPGNSFRLTLLDGSNDNRFFSIVNPPSQNDRIVTAARVGESAFKKILQSMPLGSEVEISSVAGVFTVPEHVTDLIFIAGGIGITPFMSMLRHEQERLKQNKNILLFYSNPDRKSMAYGWELEMLQQALPKFRLSPIFSKDPAGKGESQRISASLVTRSVANPQVYFYMISGPPLMVQDIYEALIALDVKAKNIKTEEFTGY